MLDDRIEVAISNAVAVCSSKIGHQKIKKNELAFLAIWHLFFWKTLRECLPKDTFNIEVNAYHVDKSPTVKFDPICKKVKQVIKEKNKKWCECELADILYSFNYKNTGKRKAVLIQAKMHYNNERDYSSLKQNNLYSLWPSFEFVEPESLRVGEANLISLKNSLMKHAQEKLRVAILSKGSAELIISERVPFQQYIKSAILDEPEIGRIYSEGMYPRVNKISSLPFMSDTTKDDATAESDNWDWTIKHISDKIRNRTFTNTNVSVLNKDLKKGGKGVKRETFEILSYMDSLYTDNQKFTNFVADEKMLEKITSVLKFIYYDINIEMK